MEIGDTGSQNNIRDEPLRGLDWKSALQEEGAFDVIELRHCLEEANGKLRKFRQVREVDAASRG